MTTDEIMDTIDERKTELRRLTREIWGAPVHVAITIEPRIQELNQDIQNLKAQLYKANGGTLDNND